MDIEVTEDNNATNATTYQDVEMVDVEDTFNRSTQDVEMTDVENKMDIEITEDDNAATSQDVEMVDAEDMMDDD